MDLETAIEKVIEGYRRSIRPKNNPIFNQCQELHIKTILKAPLNKESLEKQMAEKKTAAESSTTIDVTQTLVWELEALERIYGLVRAKDRGEPLEHLAY